MTSDVAALETVVVNDPHNDTARFMLADAVEEAGDRHRAKYLREIRRGKFVQRVAERRYIALAPEDMPPKIKPGNVTNYWSTVRPPVMSDRCEAIRRRIGSGWRLPGHLHGMGYQTAAEYFGVYIYEYLHWISPLDHLYCRPREPRS